MLLPNWPDQPDKIKFLTAKTTWYCFEVTNSVIQGQKLWDSGESFLKVCMPKLDLPTVRRLEWFSSNYYVAKKTKTFPCLNLRNHTHHLSFQHGTHMHITHTTPTHCLLYSREFTAHLIFQQEEEELWKDRDLAKTHTHTHKHTHCKYCTETELEIIFLLSRWKLSCIVF